MNTLFKNNMVSGHIQENIKNVYKKRRKKVVQKVKVQRKKLLESLLSDLNIITNRLFQIF